MINLIVATSENGCIGRDGLLPWNKQKSDMKNFRALTLGHPVIMGRKTYESIPFDLDDRYQIVLTRAGSIGHGQNFCGLGNTCIATNVDEALSIASSFDADPFVIGGAEVYKLFLPVADRIFRTIIHAEIEGDAFFNVPEGWTLVEEKRHSSDTNNEYDYTYQLFQRVTGS
mgnify:CR=1 FL=1|tara:strand:+ start:4251 stop:4763 length:513 start_codon:yes stop_codon:yes gene_type:complete